MPDQTLNQTLPADDLRHAPAATPATARIVPDAPVADKDDAPESPPPPDRPEIEPNPAPETDPALQPEIPPVESPSI